MPFDSSGTYTPPTGATTAAPGDVIRSSIWNSVFTDLSNALTLLGTQLYSTTPVTTTPYVPLSTDATLLVNVGGASVINLPSAASRDGYPVLVKDTSGAAATNNITINRDGTDTIDGLTNIKITSNYGAYWLQPITGGWIIRP